MISAATPLVLSSISAIPLPPTGPLRVSDYGTADAGTSLGLMSEIVTKARERGVEEVVLQYEDQKDNEVSARACTHVIRVICCLLVGQTGRGGD